MNRKWYIVLLAVVLVLLLVVLFLRREVRDYQQPVPSPIPQNNAPEMADPGKTGEEIKTISALELKEKLVEPILGYYPGTAGSSLKRAVAATEVLAFAAEYGECDVSAVPDLLTTEEERTRFSENLNTIADLLEETEADFDSLSGLYEDAGIYEKMSKLSDNTDAWNSLHLLITNLQQF